MTRPSGTSPEHRPHGLIVLDKPPGPSSYDCIRLLRRTCRLPRKWKVGHLGTLDPFAAGVLVVALGQAVRYAEFALHAKKIYRARLYLGEQTDTLDPTGRIIDTAHVPPDWPDRLPEIRPSFIGALNQTPPAFSAKQVDGVRSYKAARKGESLALQPARVTIHSLEFGDTGENWVDFTAEVSGGTYLRSLGRDIALALGTVGHLLGLERLAVGPFTNEMSIPLDAFEVGGYGVLEHHLKPIDPLIAHLPACRIRPEREEKLIHGRPLAAEDIDDGFPALHDDTAVLRILDVQGSFRALGRIEHDPPRIVPYKPWLA